MYLQLVLLSKMSESPDSLHSDSLRLRSLQESLYGGKGLDISHVVDSLQAENLIFLSVSSGQTVLYVLELWEKILRI